MIVEPVCGNMGVIPPEPRLPGVVEGAYPTVRRGADLRRGDHRVPGGPGRRPGTFTGVVPDLTCLGKILGGGLPVGAFGGRLDIMSCLAPVGPVYQAGTLSGNPVTVAAGLATLKALEAPGVYRELEEKGRKLEEGLKGVLGRGVRGTVNRVGSMLTLFSRHRPGRRSGRCARLRPGTLRALLPRGCWRGASTCRRRPSRRCSCRCPRRRRHRRDGGSVRRLGRGRSRAALTGRSPHVRKSSPVSNETEGGDGASSKPSFPSGEGPAEEPPHVPGRQVHGGGLRVPHHGGSRAGPGVTTRTNTSAALRGWCWSWACWRLP